MYCQREVPTPPPSRPPPLAAPLAAPLAPPLAPPLRGPGKLPRYGSGWMHQFGHVYSLQQEMLSPRAADWFRACELWHTARHEGLALNQAHYAAICRQLVPARRWETALDVLRQMRRDAVRPDAVIVGSVLAACADARQWEQACAVYTHFTSVKHLRPNDSMRYALATACARAGKWTVALEAANVYELPDVQVAGLIEASQLEAATEDHLAFTAVLARSQRLGPTADQLLRRLAPPVR